MGSTPTMTIANDVLIASANWDAYMRMMQKTARLLLKKFDNGLRFRNGNILYKENSLWVAKICKAKLETYIN
ncbi:MAG: hypothetical protein ABWY22_12625 [Flavobacterium sp.]